MNFLFRTLVLFGAIIVAGLFTALLAPMWIDWSHYTEEFETEVSDMLGQPVKVQGDTTLRLLPLPFIRFEGLEVGRNVDGTPLMTVDAFSLNAEIIPLLSGDLQIVDIEMVRPVVNLQFGEDGQLAWTNPSTLPIAPAQIEIERLLVTDGSGTIAGLVDGREYAFEKLDAEISADTLLGPWRVAGTTIFEGDDTGFSVSTGSFQSESKSLRIKLDLEPQALPYNFMFNGPVMSNEGVPQWSGEFEVKPRSVADLVDEVSPKVPLPINLGGAFDMVPSRADVAEYRLEVATNANPYVVTGKGTIAFGQRPRFQIEADGRQIQLETLTGAGTSNNGDEGIALRDRMESVRALLEKIPLPGIEGVIDIRLPAVLAGDTIIRDVAANISPEGSGWRINRMNVLLPGNTTLETNGRLDVDGVLGFDGQLLVASRQPTGLVNWMGGEVSSQIRGLKRVGLDAHVTLSPNQLTFEGMELRLDDAVLTGKLQRLQPSTGTPAVVIEISGNRVNTENLIALYSLVGQDGDALAADHHFNVAIKADELLTRFRDIPVDAKNVDAKLHIADGNLSVERLNASDFFGAKIDSRGRIENLTTRPNGNFKVTVEAQTAAGLFGFFNKASGGSVYMEPFARDRSLSAETRLEIEFDATSLDDNVEGRVVAKGALGGSQIAALLQFAGGLELGEKLPLQLNATVENGSVLKAMRQFGLETLPDIFGDEPQGPASASLTLDGSVAEGFDSRFSATTRNSSFSFAGKAGFSDRRLVDANGDVRLVSGDLLPYLNSLGVRLPVEIKNRLSASFKGKLRAEGDNYHLTGLEGRLAGVMVSSADVSVDAGEAVTDVNANVLVSDFDAGMLAEALLGRSPNTNLPGYVEPERGTVFTTAYYPTMKARLDLTAERMSIGSQPVGEAANMSLTMDENLLTVDQFEFNAMGGKLSGAASLANNQGDALASASYRFDELSVDALLDAVQVGGLDGGTLTGTGSFEASGSSLETLISSVSGEGFAVLSDSRLHGFDATAFAGVLAAADQNRFEVNAQSVTRLVSDIVMKSHLDIDRADVPYSITQGRLKVRNITRKTESAVFRGGFEASLVDGKIESAIDVSFLPGRRETYVGAEPQLTVSWTGDRSSLERRIDASALEGYLSLRALETSQRRIEMLEAGVFEKQRFLALASYEQQKRAHEEKLREQARAIAEEIARQEAEEQERQRLEAEAARQKQLEAEAEAEEARLKALEEEQLRRLEEAEANELQPQALPTQPTRPANTSPRAREPAAEPRKPRRTLLDLFRRNEDR